MSKKLRKKNIKNSKNEYKALTGVLLQHYNGFKFDRNLSKNDNKDHKKFNNMLREYLLSCEKNDFLPSKELVEKKCTEFSQDISDSHLRKELPEEKENPNIIDKALKEMDFLPIVTRQNEKSEDLDGFLYLKVIGIVSIRNLIKKEIDYILDAFKDDGELEEGFFKISLMSVVVSEKINSEKQDQINDLLKRKARNKLKKYFISKGMNTDFKYSTIDKIKDFWLDGGI